LFRRIISKIKALFRALLKRFGGGRTETAPTANDGSTEARTADTRRTETASYRDTPAADELTTVTGALTDAANAHTETAATVADAPSADTAQSGGIIVDRRKFDKAKWFPFLIVGIILIVIYKTMDNMAQIASGIFGFIGVLGPLLFGILFAYFLYIPHRAIENLYKKLKLKFVLKHARGLSTITVFILLLCVIIVLSSVVIPMIFNNIVDLVMNIPGYISSILAYFERLPEDSVLAGFNIDEFIRDGSGEIMNAVLNPAGIEQAARSLMGVAGGIFSVIMGLVISLYLLMDRSKIAEYFTRLNNAVFKTQRKREGVVKYLRQVNEVLLTFIASKGLDAVINFASVTCILLIFGVPYAVLLGLLAGVFNFIPYIGSIFASILISVLALLTLDLSTAIQVAVCLLIFQQLDGNYIEPRIMKSSLKINPILVIIAVVIGGAYFGIAGMFLAVPIAVIAKQILGEYIASSEAANGGNNTRR